MKNLFIFVLAGVMSLVIAACNSQGKDTQEHHNVDESDAKSVAAPVTEVPEAEAEAVPVKEESTETVKE